ncbi:MAG: transposase, partial [Moritella sp.]
TYLVDVLLRISLHPASDIEALTPRAWKNNVADEFFVSDLAIMG